MRFLVGAAVAGLVAIGCGMEMESPSAWVDASEYGAAWPLRVPRGMLTCEMHREITFQWKGTQYSLTAPSPAPAGRAYADVAAIRDGDKDLAPLIERGRLLCR